MPGTAQANYCYRCGKHVRKGGGRCWYCYAPIDRVIRPPRKCRFCDEAIGPKALKCPHCGEFQDEGPSSRDIAMAQARAGGAAQITYVIDKAVIQGEKPLLLQGGQPVPPEVSSLLTDRTVRAIELGQPDLIDQEGVKALPAPSAPGETPGAKEGHAARRAVVRRDDALVAAEAGSDQERGIVRGAGALLGRLADFALGRFEEPAPAPERRAEDVEIEAVEASDEDTYGECAVCHSEVLAADNYCFHCGGKLRPEADGRPSAMTGPSAPSNAGHYFMALFFTGISVLLSLLPADMITAGFPGVARIFQIVAVLLMLVSVFVLGSAFLRRRTSLSQLTTIVLLAVWAACAVLIGVRFFK